MGKGDHKASRQGGLRDARSGPAAAEVPSAPRGTEKERALLAAGQDWEKQTQCLEGLEGEESHSVLLAESRALLLSYWVMLLFPPDL